MQENRCGQAFRHKPANNVLPGTHPLTFCSIHFWNGGTALEMTGMKLFQSPEKFIT